MNKTWFKTLNTCYALQQHGANHTQKENWLIKTIRLGYQKTFAASHTSYARRYKLPNEIHDFHTCTGTHTHNAIIRYCGEA